MTVAKKSSDTPAARYYVTHEGRVRGPFDLDLIEAMVMSGNFPPNIPVCKAGSQEWSLLPPTTLSRVPALTIKQPSCSSKPGGSNLALVVVGSIVTLFAVGALFNDLSKLRTQRTSEQPAVTEAPSATPPPVTPTYTPPVTETFGDAAGKTYRVPQWANPGLVAKKAAVDAQEASLNSLKSQVEALNNQIERERAYLDQTNQYAIDAFNREVDHYNALHQQLKDGIDVFNTSVNDYNAELARVGTPTN